MKFLLRGLLFIAFFIGYTFLVTNFTKKAEQVKTANVSGLSAEWGCYQEAQRLCPRMSSAKDSEQCREDALLFCPKVGAVFKKFMEQGLKRR